MPANIVTGSSRQLLREEAEKLERALCGWIPTAHCVLVGSAGEGLCLSLIAAGVKIGDKVLCSGFAPELTTRCIAKVGGIPVRVDINPNSLNIDPFCLEYVLSKCLRTGEALPKAVVATDMFGLPCNYGQLKRICGEYGVALIEDMGQSFGAELNGQRAGSFGRFAVASFSAPEAEEGGAVLCRDAADATLIGQWLRPLYDDARSFVQASYAGEWLKDRLENMQQRVIVAETYRRALSGVCRVQQVEKPYVSAYTQFVATLPEPQRKEEILARLRAQDVRCGEFKMPGGERMSEIEHIMLVNTRTTYDKLISLPISHYLTEHMAQRIGELVRQAAGG